MKSPQDMCIFTDDKNNHNSEGGKGEKEKKQQQMYRSNQTPPDNCVPHKSITLKNYQKKTPAVMMCQILVW